MPSLSKADWETYLSNYCHGEKSGSMLISRLTDFAPGEAERKWVKQWAAEEMEHHKLWDSLIAQKKIAKKEMAEGLANIYSITDGFVSARDWPGSMVSAAIIEHMSNAAASYLFRDADTQTKQIFRRITGDDLAHLDFDIEQIGKAAQTKDGRKSVMNAHKAFLKEIMQWPGRASTTDTELKILNDTYQLHRFKMKSIGVKLPDIWFSRGWQFRIRKAIIGLFV